MPMNK